MKIKLLLLLFTCLTIPIAFSQQDAQYTQYMYNTQVVNPAYAGTGEILSFGLLYRTQWVGFEGAPKTGTFTVNSPIGRDKNMGLGVSIVRDEIGPAIESNINIDYSYHIETSRFGKLSFGVKAGIDVLDIDFTKLNISEDQEFFLQDNIDNKIQPQVGAGLYYSTYNFYAGLSVPNFLATRHFIEDTPSNSNRENIASEKLHYFFITGYVFDINRNLKIKPATLVKAVSGSPLQWDISTNFLFNDRFTLGAAYRLSASFSALAGFQTTDTLFIGFGYDHATTNIEQFSNGSYEIMLRFDLSTVSERYITPRFF